MKTFNKLLNLLKYKRPAWSWSEEQMIHNYIDCIEGMTKDAFGNRILRIGDEPVTMFSSHTDTVHDSAGFQTVYHDTVKKEYFVKEDCLGADDGAGIIAMIHLIQNKIPGLYVFHRAEEIGGQGSDYIRKETPELLDNISRCIAFDRKGTTSIITHQGCERTCSDEFATALGSALSTDKMFWMNDDTGSFTDSANYTELIPECTNVSIGYNNEHTSNETLKIDFLEIFLEQITCVNYGALPTVRDPEVPEFMGYGLEDKLNYFEITTIDQCVTEGDYLDFVYDSPEEAARVLQEMNEYYQLTMGYSDSYYDNDYYKDVDTLYSNG